MSEINPKIVKEARKVIRESEAGRKVLDAGGDTPAEKPPAAKESILSRQCSLETRSTSAVIVDLLAATLAALLALWLFSASTIDQKRAVHEYFSLDGPVLQRIEPSSGSPEASRGASPPGNWRGGGVVVLLPKAAAGSASSASSATGGSFAARIAATSGTYLSTRELEDQRFREVEIAIRSTLGESEALRRLARHVRVNRIAEGLHIQLTDRAGLALFPRGSARMHAHTRLLLLQVAEAIGPLPNDIELVTHTRPGPEGGSTGPGTGRTDERLAGRLTADRAYASRRVLVDAGIAGWRFRKVGGAGGRVALSGSPPHSPENERISIIVFRSHFAAR